MECPITVTKKIEFPVVNRRDVSIKCLLDSNAFPVNCGVSCENCIFNWEVYKQVRGVLNEDL